ncbi:TPT-domain-containing protein [Nadsonia fulvescens var. elongata DSM 6958]|uniref:TPT-domain-containing protein n=1 Tax=Nadsonia fulvescens var. elongata DSM 6958 TaxID=857566 RepID=A0A1E3PD97_9ASCO|nr:TPT-domain-containing protein [Nadsonia fulvescens var. elongata DSM 6958]
MATRIIPVSLVHTIKALSPLFTVMAYRLIFRVKYKSNTYLTLIPLTVGVMLTCSTEFSAQYVGIFYALIATLIFVSQNMFSKKLLTHSSHNDNISIANSNSKGNGGNSGAKKFDKLTILIYCSALAFIFTFPIWFFSEGLTIIKQVYYYQTSSPFYTGVVASTIKASQIGYSIRSLFTQFLLNGVIHFLQNILSFQVLGMVSPVTYSVASLVKRIVVIVVAIIWFGQKVNWVQGWGIALTFTGLYLYDRFGVDKKSNKVELVKTRVLPK